MNTSESNMPAHPKIDFFGLLIIVLVSIWIILVTGGQLITQYIVSGIATTLPNIVYTFFPIIQGLLLVLVLLPLVIFVKHPVYRATFQAWLLAAALGIANSVTHLTPFSAAQAQALIHIVLGVCYTILVLFFAHRRQKHLNDASAPHLARPSISHILQALVISALFAYPWLAWGALGSIQETLLQLLAALVIGLAATTTIEHYISRSLRLTPIPAFTLWLVEGFSISILLLLFLAGLGFPFGAMQLLLMLCVSTLAWILSPLISSAASQQRAIWLPLTILLGLSLAAPFTLIDPDELYLATTASAGETLTWAFYAALASATIAGLFAVGALITRAWSALRPTPNKSEYPVRAAKTPQISLLSILLLAAWVGGVFIYFSTGQPGLHGEGMFIILDDQADLSQAAAIQDVQARRQYVYDTLVSHSNATQADLRQVFDRLGLDYTPYYLVNAIQVKGNVFIHLWLLTRPEVDRILANPWLRPLPATPTEGIGYPDSANYIHWNLTMIGADQVWEEYGITGEGIIVGQSDSGVQGSHPQLADSYRGRDGQNDYNWFDPWYGSTQPTDIGGHGTHTLGTILGKTTGVAPGATWYGCVNLARNLGNPALYMDCMQFMLAPFPQNGNPLQDGDPSRGAHVINNSWGCPEIEGCDATSLLYGVRNLRLAGIFVVASAGNDGPYCNTLNTPPAIYDEAFSVGAIDHLGEIAYFSSIGPVTSDGSQRVKPDIMAPGVDIYSSMPGSTYATNSGTSMAGPHVVGVVALIWSANPALIGNIEATEQIILQTASPYTGTLPDCPGAYSDPSTAVGYGVINAYEAVKAALNWR